MPSLFEVQALVFFLFCCFDFWTPQAYRKSQEEVPV